MLKANYLRLLLVFILLSAIIQKYYSCRNNKLEQLNDVHASINPSKKENKRFIFIRHGTTDWSWKMLLNGPQDLPLDSAGKKHIITMARSLSNAKISPSKIFTSTLKRCLETAEIIEAEFKVLGKVPLINKMEELKEIYHGNWTIENKEKLQQIIEEKKKKIEDKEITEIAAKKEVLIRLSKDRPKDAEGWDEFKSRIYTALDNILENEPSDTFVITHGTVIKKYLKYKHVFKKISKSWTGDNRPALIIIKYPDRLEVECFTSS